MKIILGLILAAVLTVIMEIPVIRALKVCKSMGYIALVNILTNVIFNTGYILIAYYGLGGKTVYTVIAETLLIPVSEALLYLAYSGIKRSRAFIGSYIANITSFILGTVLLKLILNALERLF